MIELEALTAFARVVSFSRDFPWQTNPMEVYRRAQAALDVGVTAEELERSVAAILEQGKQEQ